MLKYNLVNKNRWRVEYLKSYIGEVSLGGGTKVQWFAHRGRDAMGPYDTREMAVATLIKLWD